MAEIDTDTAKKVMDILSNPEMMRKISAIASSASPPQPQEVPRSEDFPKPQENFPEPQKALPAFQSQNSKTDLLLAVKPLLKSEKQGKIDAIIKALTVATAISKLKSGV